MTVTSLSMYQDYTVRADWNPMTENIHFSRVYYIHGGEAYYTDKQTHIRFEKGFLYILPAQGNYRLYHNPKDPMNHLFLHVTTSPVIDHLTQIPVTEGSFLSDAVHLLEKQIHNDDFDHIFMLVELVLSLAFQSVPNYQCELSREIKALLDSHIEEPVDLDFLSKSLYISKTHLIETFKKAYLQTPMQYLNSKRLDKALVYLRSGLRISSVSEKLNYSSPSNFSLSFKKKFGISPSGYLRILKTDMEETKTML